MQKPKILVAGIGNELRQDDAFGMEFIRRWQKLKLPPHIHNMEVGIGGIHLVQELHAASGIDVGKSIKSTSRKSVYPWLSIRKT